MTFEEKLKQRNSFQQNIADNATNSANRTVDGVAPQQSPTSGVETIPGLGTMGRVGKIMSNVGSALSGNSVKPGSASSGLMSPGSYSSAGPTDLLKQQVGVGFVQVDPMRFLKTFG